jgi:hypothetical protein
VFYDLRQEESLSPGSPVHDTGWMRDALTKMLTVTGLALSSVFAALRGARGYRGDIPDEQTTTGTLAG